MVSAKTRYIVSKDARSGLWYAHMEGHPRVPVFGSLSESKRVAKQRNEAIA